MNKPFKLLAAGAVAATLLTACGGGGNDTPADPVPDSALASPDGFTAWAQSLPSNDASEPVNVDRLAMAPTSETEEPVALN